MIATFFESFSPFIATHWIAIVITSLCLVGIALINRLTGLIGLPGLLIVSLAMLMAKHYMWMDDNLLLYVLLLAFFFCAGFLYGTKNPLTTVPKKVTRKNRFHFLFFYFSCYFVTRFFMRHLEVTNPVRYSFVIGTLLNSFVVGLFLGISCASILCFIKNKKEND